MERIVLGIGMALKFWPPDSDSRYLEKPRDTIPINRPITNLNTVRCFQILLKDFLLCQGL